MICPNKLSGWSVELKKPWKRPRRFPNNFELEEVNGG
jgi:hypothetical protein